MGDEFEGAGGGRGGEEQRHHTPQQVGGESVDQAGTADCALIGGRVLAHKLQSNEGGLPGETYGLR